MLMLREWVSALLTALVYERIESRTFDNQLELS